MVRALLLALLCFAGPVHAQTAFRILYNLQSTEPSEEQSAALADYLRAHPKSYFLVRSFACDTGGFRVSLKIAEKRADRVRGILARESAPDHARYALPAVIKGEPRVDHRRLEVDAFETPQAVDLAMKQANEETARFHEAFAEEIRQPEAPQPEAAAESSNLWPLAILLSLIAALFLYFILTRAKRKKDRHAITPELAEAVAAITGEAPVVPEPKARKKKPVTP